MYALLGVALLVTGLFILSAAASRENAWAWWSHVIAAAIVVGAYIAHRVVSYARPESGRFGRYLAGVGAAALALFLVHGLIGATAAATRTLESAGPGGARTSAGARSSAMCASEGVERLLMVI